MTARHADERHLTHPRCTRILSSLQQTTRAPDMNHDDKTLIAADPRAVAFAVTYRAHIRSVLFTSREPVEQRLTVERDPRNSRKYWIRRWNSSALSGIGASPDRFTSLRAAIAHAEAIRDRETAATA